MTKKILSVIVVVLMVMALVPMSVFAKAPTASNGEKDAAPIATAYYFESDDDIADFLLVSNDTDSETWVRYTYGGVDNSACMRVHWQDDPDDWMITPAITVPTSNASVSFQAKKGGSYADTIRPYIGTTTNTADMAPLGEDITDLVSSGYNEYSYDLSAYAGQTVYFAIRYYNSPDMYYAYVDNLEFYGEGGGDPTPVDPTEVPGLNELDAALNAAGCAISFDNTSSYPWTVETEGDRVYAKSGNAGVSSSTSSISATVTLDADGIVQFDFKAFGEGTSTFWDHCDFTIDGNRVLYYGAYDNDWETAAFELTAGEHALVWSYTKDSSVNPSGDYFAVDNVYVGAPVQASAITVQPVSVPVDRHATVAYEVLPAAAFDKSVTFAIADTSIATVNENGVVTGVAEGTTTVTVTSVAVPTVSGTATVTVTAAEPAIHFYGFATYDMGSTYDSHWVAFTDAEPNMYTDMGSTNRQLYAGAYYDGTIYAITTAGMLFTVPFANPIGEGTDVAAVDADGTPTSATFVDGDLYCVFVGDEDSAIYVVDTETGACTLIGTLAEHLYAIAGNEDGDLFGINANGRLFAVDPTTAAMTQIGDTGVACAYVQDMTYVESNGKLYWAQILDGSNASFYMVDPATAAATDLGPIGSAGAEVVALFSTEDELEPAPTAVPPTEAPAGVITWDFENSTTTGWTLVDSDGDGYNWMLASDVMGEGNGHNGSVDCILSQSYDNNFGALTPDNWAITPAIEAADLSTVTFGFYACAQDAAWASEHFGIYVGNSATVDGMVLIQEYTMTAKNRAQGAWYEYTVTLDGVTGIQPGTIYFAIRHFNSTDWFYIDVDDVFVMVGGEPVNPTEPPVGPTEVPGLNDLDAALNAPGSAINFTNDANYPWTIETEGDRVYAKSGNAGVADTTSTITAVVTLEEDGIVQFDYKAWGEGSSDSYDWDKCRFYIDGNIMMDYGAHQNDWETIAFELTAGEHTLTWTYKKDSSVNPTGDYFAVDNVYVGAPVVATGIAVQAVEVGVGRHATVVYTVLPANAFDKSVTFAIADTSIATVNADGVITGVAEGTTTITVTSVANPDAHGTATVTVVPAPDAVNLYGLCCYDFSGVYDDHWVSFLDVEPGTVIDMGSTNRDAYAGAYYDGTVYGITTSGLLYSFPFADPFGNGTNIGSLSVNGETPTSAAFVDGDMYMVTAGDADSHLWAVDVVNGTATLIGALADHLYAIAGTEDGDLYGIGADGTLYSVDPMSGAATAIGSTGVSCAYVQSMTYSETTGKIYWAQILDGSNAGLYEVNPANGSATYLGNISNGMEVVALFACDEELEPAPTNAPTTPPSGDVITWDFENSTTTGWTLVDSDGDGYNWMLASSVMGTGYGHNGSIDCIISQSYDNNYGQLYPDNWAITPAIEASDLSAVTFSFWACAQDNAWASEHFGVYVGNSATPNGMVLIQEYTMTAKEREQGTWYEYTVDLNGVSGVQPGTIYFAIRHFDCTDWFYLDVDDVQVVVGGDNPPPTPTTPPTPVETITWDFENSTTNGWTLVDADGDGYNWRLASDVMGTGNGHNGSIDCILSQSYDNNYGQLYPDNWAITPAITASSLANVTFSFWACAQDNAWASEHFGVYVGNSATPNSMVLIQEYTMTAKEREQGTWYQYTVTLDGVTGIEPGTIYFAIRHFNCTDWFYLDVDDVEVTVGSDVPPVGGLGDVNGDGNVTLEDALTVMRYAQGLIGANDLDTSVADVNGDGVINFIDALLILRFAMGLIPTLPL